jgi:hypothetical protein
MTVGQLREALAFLPAEMEVYAVDGPEIVQVGALMDAAMVVRDLRWHGMPWQDAAELVALMNTGRLDVGEIYLTLVHFA